MNNSLPNNVDFEKYLALLNDDRALIRASKGMIRRKRSPMARMIETGNVRAIALAAKERLFSVMNKEKRENFCRIMCKIRDSMEKVSSSELRKDALMALSGFFVIEGMNNASAGLIIPVLWYLKGVIKKKICPCELMGDCIRVGTCRGKAV